MAYITRAELLEQVKELKAMVAELEEELYYAGKVFEVKEENEQLREETITLLEERVNSQKEKISYQEEHIEMLQRTINKLAGEEVFKVEDYIIC